ncbi:hypothetical protein [Flexithrix dorotheae]|uniref:hypothetical protein n=1 Tax=Flexithrix dorotheae TaxID=70993 RepID=UPI00036F540A|nr:hypothetical protein [Flexithrix dorotheae]
MKLFFKGILLGLVVSLLFIENSTAQLSLAVGAGGTGYSGDVSGLKIQNTEPAVNVELWYQYTRNLYLKSGASYYKIGAPDVHPSRNRAFKASNIELYTSLMYGGNPGAKLMPFAYAGLGFTTNNPQYLLSSDGGAGEIKASDLQTESEPIPNISMIFPLGVGFRYDLSKKVAFVVDAGMRVVNSDLLDGVSARTINVANLSPEEVNYFETIRPNGINGATSFGNGNPNKADVYGMLTLKLLFKLGDQKKYGKRGGSMPCPTFYNSSLYY